MTKILIIFLSMVIVTFSNEGNNSGVQNKKDSLPEPIRGKRNIKILSIKKPQKIMMPINKQKFKKMISKVKKSDESRKKNKRQKKLEKLRKMAKKTSNEKKSLKKYENNSLESQKKYHIIKNYNVLIKWLNSGEGKNNKAIVEVFDQNLNFISRVIRKKSRLVSMSLSDNKFLMNYKPISVEYNESGIGKTEIFDLSGKVIRKLNYEGSGMQISPNGKYATTSGPCDVTGSYKFDIIDISNDKVIKIQKVLYSQIVSAGFFSNNTLYLLLSEFENEIRVEYWDIEKKELIYQKKVNNPETLNLRFSKSGIELKQNPVKTISALFFKNKGNTSIFFFKKSGKFHFFNSPSEIIDFHFSVNGLAVYSTKSSTEGEFLLNIYDVGHQNIISSTISLFTKFKYINIKNDNLIIVPEFNYGFYYSYNLKSNDLDLIENNEQIVSVFNEFDIKYNNKDKKYIIYKE